MVHVLSLRPKTQFLHCSGHRVLGEGHLDVIHSLALLCHRDRLRSARPGKSVGKIPRHLVFLLVLYLECSVGPLPEPLPDADIVKVLGRRNVIRKAEEVQTKTIG